MYLESRGLAANTINQPLAAVRRLAHEAADSGLLSPELAAGISRVKGVRQLVKRGASSEVLNHACGDSVRAKRDYAMLAMLFACGCRRAGLVRLEPDEVQMSGSLGGGGSDRQGRPHSHGTDSVMGEGRARSAHVGEFIPLYFLPPRPEEMNCTCL